MNRNLARTGLIALTVATGFTQGQPLAPLILGLLAWFLIWLTNATADVIARGIEDASQRRIAEISWQIRTDAAHLALQRRRLAAANEPGYYQPMTPAYGTPLLCGLSA